ncbi:hypothetical protein SAMN04490196_0134 [Pseudomonas moraviensis]|nr:hypothetical protein SAMN04490196_0134 [Pseudomonas moraviensis]
MTYGARVWDENGNLAMDTNSSTYQVIWQGVIDFSGNTPSYTLNIPGFNPANCVFMIIPTRAQDVQPSENDSSGNLRSYPYVTTAVGQVVVQPKNPSSTTGLQSKVVSKAYAIRFAT